MTLTHTEQVALAASARLLMTADGRVTEGESAIVERFASRLGISADEWRAVWDEAARNSSRERALDLAAAVSRREARELIYELLHELASDAYISDPEWNFLEWLDSTWGTE